MDTPSNTDTRAPVSDAQSQITTPLAEGTKRENPYLLVRPHGGNDPSLWTRLNLRDDFYSLIQFPEGSALMGCPKESDSISVLGASKHPAGTVFETVQPSDLCDDGSKVTCVHHLVWPVSFESERDPQSGEIRYFESPGAGFFFACISHHDTELHQLITPSVQDRPPTRPSKATKA